MKPLMFLLSLLLFSSAIKAQTDQESTKPVLFYIEAAGGLIRTLALPTYNTDNPILNRGEVNVNAGYYALRFGARLHGKYHLGIGAERSLLLNGFAMRTRNNEGISVHTYESNYILTYGQFAYDVLSSKRFVLAPLIRVGVGFGDPLEVSNATTTTTTIEFTDPMTGQVDRTAYTTNSIQSKPIIFVYGAGVLFDWMIIPDKLGFGLEMHLLHAPYEAVQTYAIDYRRNNEPRVVFETASTLLTINLGLRLRYFF